MSKIVLSARLRALAQHVPKGAALADIGSDHGSLPLALLEEKQVRRAIAGDVLPDPMAHAQALAQSLGYGADQASFRVGDGLAVLRPGEADTLLIAGMGADLIIRILTEGERVRRSVDLLILSPHSKPWRLRSWASAHGLAPRQEEVIQDRGRFYEIQVYGQGQAALDPFEAYFGPYLLKQGQDPIVQAYFARRRQRDQARLQGLRHSQAPSAQDLSRAQTLEGYWQRKEDLNGQTR